MVVPPRPLADEFSLRKRRPLRGAPLTGCARGWRPARSVLIVAGAARAGAARAGAARPRAAVAARVALVVLARSAAALIVLGRTAPGGAGRVIALIVLVALIRRTGRVALAVLVALVGRSGRRVAGVALVLIALIGRVRGGRVALVVLVALVRVVGGRAVVALVALIGGVLHVVALLVLVALIVGGGVVAFVVAGRQVEADDAGGVRGQVLQRARERAGRAHDPEHREQRDDRGRDPDQDPRLAVLHGGRPSLRRPRCPRGGHDGVACRPRDRVALVGEELGFVRDRGEVRGRCRRLRRERRAQVVDEPGEVEVLVAAVAGEQRLEVLVRDLGIDTHLVWRNVERAHRVTAPAAMCLRIAASPLACSIFTAPSFFPTTCAISPMVRPPRIRRRRTSRWSTLRWARTSSTCAVARSRIASSSASPRGAARRSCSSPATSTGRCRRLRTSSTTRFRPIVKTHVRNAASSPSNPSMYRTTFTKVSPTTSSGSGTPRARRYRVS